MSLYNLPNSTAGLDNIFVQTISEVPFLSSLFLLFIFFVIFLGGIVRQTLRTGTADHPLWSVIASLSIMIVSFIMSISLGYISLDTLSTVVVITILSGIWFFWDRKGANDI